ncbi:MAG: hypothetical protein R3229_16990, partial [Alphaproteobacteria bacterium]|nr:hypothetical protein [Alphaproteobacteria bacterium]
RKLKKSVPGWIKRLGAPIGQRQHGYSIFRVAVPKGVHPRVVKDEHTWIVTLNDEIPAPVAGIPVEPHFQPGGAASLHLTAHDARAAMPLQDPEAGDQIWVVPMVGGGKGIGIARRFVEVRLLPTVQGIAGFALRDGVKFETLRQGVRVTAPGGLTLSGTNARAPLPRPARGKSASRKVSGQSWLFDIAELYQASADSFAAVRHKLLEAAYTAQPAEQSKARLRLAQLHFAHGNYAEVTGVLQVIQADEPEFVEDPVFRALRGASLLLQGATKKARRDLFHSSLDAYKEISLWRGAIEAQDRYWAAASRHFSRTEDVMRSYPRQLRIYFGLLAAETALRIGDVALTKYYLETLQALKPSRSVRPRLEYLRGHLLAKTLDPEAAVEAWTRAMRGADPKVRVQAALAKAESLLKHGKIDVGTAANEMEKLRYMWRGDHLEFEVLVRLGKAYLASGDFKNGLLTLRDAARFYPEHPETSNVVDRMRAAFTKLYVQGGADKLPPLVSLALYDEFRELTPPGKVGDDLIAKLARRLVGVDLLDRSARLLKHLVDRRLTGTERFDAANRLGLVYILDRKPEKALAALSGALPKDIAPKVATSRRHLKARALGELARYDKALALLTGDDSRDAALLRAEMYWRLKNWRAAAKAYEALIAASTEKGADAADSRQRYILSLAISHALSGNVYGLANVRKRFAPEMAKSRYYEAFNLVSGHSGPVPEDYRIITQKVSEVDLFRTFMKTYREKLLPPPAKGDQQAASASPRPAEG